MIAARILRPRWTAAQHRQIDHYAGLTEARIESRSAIGEDPTDTRPFPVQVDGDFIGEHRELDLRLDPAALTILA
jgi:hypothetical protein